MGETIISTGTAAASIATSARAPHAKRSNRAAPIIGVALVHGLIAWGLLFGLGAPRVAGEQGKRLQIFELPPLRERASPNPPKLEKPAGRPPAEGRVPQKPAAPPAIAIPLPTALPTVIAPAVPAAADGTGAAGEGAGGAGSGEGSGRGDGDGYGEVFTSARQVRGSFRNSDFPPEARDSGRLRIGVRYAVNPAGRVQDCEITEPSGYGEVDAMTCRVIVERYVFKPARDQDGVAITEVLEERYSWTGD